MIIVPIVCVVAIVLCWLAIVLFHALLEEHLFWQCAFDGLFAAGVLYFVVRFIHWAWLTPIPFVIEF